MKALIFPILWAFTTHFCLVSPKILLRRFDPSTSCDPRWFTFGSLQLQSPRPGVTRLIGTVGLLQNLGINVTIFSQLAREGRSAHISERVDVCDYVKDQYKSWSLQVQPIRSGCPIQRGRYNVLNLTINEAHGFRTGDYKLQVATIRNGVELCSAAMYFSVQNPALLD